jgi:hypothetical protein
LTGYFFAFNPNLSLIYVVKGLRCKLSGGFDSEVLVLLEGDKIIIKKFDVQDIQIIIKSLAHKRSGINFNVLYMLHTISFVYHETLSCSLIP